MASYMYLKQTARPLTLPPARASQRMPILTTATHPFATVGGPSYPPKLALERRVPSQLWVKSDYAEKERNNWHRAVNMPVSGQARRL